MPLLEGPGVRGHGSDHSLQFCCSPGLAVVCGRRWLWLNSISGGCGGGLCMGHSADYLHKFSRALHTLTVLTDQPSAAQAFKVSL